MATYITLGDGRVFGTSNAVFDALLVCTAQELERQSDVIDGLREWLLDQRCEVQGPGVGYLVLRELSPRAAFQFKSACTSAFSSMERAPNPAPWLDQSSLLIDMWASINKGEPPEALTSPHWLISPWSRDRRGPGWE
jgi:hypothetical protein